MQAVYADIIVDITSEKLDRTFQYRIPENMRGQLHPGMVVTVPFGSGSRQIRGYCVSLSEKPGIDPQKIKEISAVVTDGLGEEARLVSLAFWMKKRYGCTAISALKTVIPVKQKVRRREKKTIVLALPLDEAREKLALYEKKHQSARARLLSALVEQPVLPWELAGDKLNITLSVVRFLQEQGVIRIEDSSDMTGIPGLTAENPSGAPLLNEDQRLVVDAVIADWGRMDTPYGRRYLIHGVTGSGKTEIYMALIAEALARGQQAIVLIPEIALTYQTLVRFYRRFGRQVAVINSRLSAGERYELSERARTGQVSVMIGPRSALFTPFPNLGIIVIDEEHEPAYISETSPRYHADEVAFRRADMEGAAVVLGSATPSLDSYYAARSGFIRLFTLKNRATGASMARTEIVDLREELKSGNRSILSRRLQEAVGQALKEKHQVMLFLNRRGYAGFISCRSCGHVIKCPHCDVSLTLHKNGKMVCHYCGYTEERRRICPKCGSPFLRSFRAGTEQIEEEVRRLFPQARILRMDMDTTRTKDSYTKILSAFAGHEADILIGTQMIVKGHDFPDVTVMGILAADLSLNAPDFRAAERTFQLLTQAAGRAGRSEYPGRVIIQTYSPYHYAIETAARQDYEDFYRQECAYRQLAGYPPCGSMTAIHLSGPDEEYLSKACGYLSAFASRLAEKHGGTVLGPVDESVRKIQDIYRKVLYIRHSDGDTLERIRLGIERYIELNRGFDSLTVTSEKC